MDGAHSERLKAPWNGQLSAAHARCGAVLLHARRALWTLARESRVLAAGAGATYFGVEESRLLSDSRLSARLSHVCWSVDRSRSVGDGPRGRALAENVIRYNSVVDCASPVSREWKVPRSQLVQLTRLTVDVPHFRKTNKIPNA